MKRSIRFSLTLRNELQENLETNLQYNNEELEVRMWYLDRFSLTPFDERYLKVPYEWMYFTYQKFMENYNPEEIRIWYRNKKAKEKEKKTEDKKNKAFEKQIELSYGNVDGKEIWESMRNAK